MAPPPPRPAYFFRMAALMLVLSVLAFADNLFTDVTQASNRDPKLVVHGLFGLAWYLMLLVQANLVRVRSLALHRQVGLATLVVALGLTLSTLYLFVVLWKGWANMSEEVRANRLLLPGFAFFVFLAGWYRGRADWHKRLVFCATFMMLGPVLARLYDPLVLPLASPVLPNLTPEAEELGFLIYLVAVGSAFFLSLVVHDLRTLRRWHPVTLSGLAWFALAWTISVVS